MGTGSWLCLHFLTMLHHFQRKTGLHFCFIVHFDIFPCSFYLRGRLRAVPDVTNQQQPLLGEEKGTKSFAVHWGWEGRVNDSGPSAFHSRWKAWLEWRQTSLQRKDGVHFYNQDNNKRPRQRSADVSFLPNEARDNHARIKRPLWSGHTRFYLWLPPF